MQADERFDRGAWGSAFGGLKKDGVVDLDKGAIVIVDAERASFFVDRLMPELFEKFSDAGIEIDDFPGDIVQYIEANARKTRAGARLLFAWMSARSGFIALRMKGSACLWRLLKPISREMRFLVLPPI